MKKGSDEVVGVGKLLKTLSESSKKISEAWQAAKDSIAEETPHLSCLKSGNVDFKLIGEDVRYIQQKLFSQKFQVLGSYVIINDKEDFFEIKTYFKKVDGSTTLLDTVKFKVESVSNLPSDVHQKLQQEGQVELYLGVLDN